MIDKEKRLRKQYFKTEELLKHKLYMFLLEKYNKYSLKQIKLKKNVKHKGNRVGKYISVSFPICVGDACIHEVEFDNGRFFLREDQFEIYKPKDKK